MGGGRQRRGGWPRALTLSACVGGDENGLLRFTLLGCVCEGLKDFPHVAWLWRFCVSSSVAGALRRACVCGVEGLRLGGDAIWRGRIGGGGSGHG